MPIDSEQPILIRSTDGEDTIKIAGTSAEADHTLVDLIQKVNELHVQTFTRDGHGELSPQIDRSAR